MRWHSAVLILIPAISLLAWLALGHRSDSTLKPSPTTAPERSAKGPVVLTESKRQEYIHNAAKLIVELEEKDPDMGGKQLKKRYDELLREEQPLRQEYEAIKAERAKIRSVK